jgi:hypothetical protein
MRAFPPSADLPPFIGDTLWQIRFDPNSLQFVFESGLRLVSQDSTEHVQPDGRVLRYENEAFRDPPTLLHRLIGKSVTSVGREDLMLTLTFSDGAVLRVFSEVGAYESGQIEHADGSVTIF